MADAAHRFVARFERADELVAAVDAARAAGLSEPETFAPFPVPALEARHRHRGRRIPGIALVTAVVAGGLAYLLQWYSATVEYAFVVGGKPLHSAPAFMLVTFEFAILGAVLATVIAMLAGNGLPRPHHPVFDWPAFDRASRDGFFMLLEHDDPDAAAAFLRAQAAVEIEELGS